jgi:hypothetical protein
VRGITAAAVVASLVAVSTGSIAAAPTAPRTAAPSTNAASPNPWIALSAMTSTSSSAATAVAAQGDGEGGFPPIVPLVVILGTIALGVYVLTKSDDDDPLGFPISA